MPKPTPQDLHVNRNTEAYCPTAQGCLRRLPCCNAALLGVLTATIFEFHKVSPDAAYLLLPYLGWSTFAAVLTLDIWRRNPQVHHTMSLAVAFTLPQLLTWCSWVLHSMHTDELQYMLQWYVLLVPLGILQDSELQATNKSNIMQLEH